MIHEITWHDNVVSRHMPAWHGLGVVVPNAPNLMEALKIAELDGKLK